MSETPLGELLELTAQPEKITAPESERFVTVKLNNGGAVERVIAAGKTPKPFTGYRVSAGQFIYSRIDARNGAFAIVPDHLHGAVVSKDFPTFKIRKDLIDPQYLLHYLRSGRLQQKIRASSFGATNRQRIKEESFLRFTLPLPPLEEQRRIATILEHASTLEHRANRSVRTLRSMLRHQAQRFEADPKLPRLPLIDLGVNFTSGKNVVGSDTDQHPSRRIIKTSAVSYGTFDPSESKPLPLEYDPPSAHRILPSDLLFTRASGSIDMIGVATFVPEIGQELFLPDKVWRTELATTSPLTLHYLYAAFLSPRFRSYVANEASGASGVRNISKMKVLRFAVPVPSYGEQQQLSVLFEKVDKHLRTLENRASSTSSLTKSLQSRAFRGEL